MLFPDQISGKLGFDELKSLIKKECLSPMGAAMVEKMQFISNHDLLKKLLQQTHEFKQILGSGDHFPSEHYYDLKALLAKVKVEGTYLTEEEFFKVKLALETVAHCIAFFKNKEGLYPQIESLFKDLVFERSVIRSIEQVLDAKGKIKPNASKALADINFSISSAESEARRKINSIYKEAQKEGYTTETQLTVREGRLAIPVLAEYKRKVKGIILDESSTGQTVFIEPTEVFELNNRIRDLEFERRKEIIRILMVLTDELRPNLPLLLSYHQLLSILDFIRAKASFAIQIDADMPILKKEPLIKIYKGRHPLLYLSFRASHKTVVPLDIEIDDEFRLVLVSGPNAGGKSVAMKTVGLLQLMLQHGLLVPASSYSEFGVFKNIFVDIGDDQSMESDLSTYSAHLTYMKFFVENATAHTLILIDEFGTGTDPKFGGPMAEAVLELLNHKKVRGVITTHYSNLKIFASNTPGLRNASMMFDNVQLMPLYRLEAGKPGSSYAFEIAEKIGLPKNVMNLAKQKIGQREKRVDTLLVDLEREKNQINDLKEELLQKEQKLAKLAEETGTLKNFLEENKKKLLKDAKQEAERIIKSANKLIENTIAGIKDVQAGKEETKKIREKLKEEAEVLINQEEEAIPVKKSRPKTGAIKTGDWVRIKESDTVGEVIQLIKNSVEIAIGDIRTKVNISRVEHAEKPKVQKVPRWATAGSVMTEAVRDFNPQIDLRGKRGDEAIIEVDKFIDRALMMGFGSIRILHGKGDGILRKLIREYLKKYSEVQSLEDEHVEFGGDGITIVKLR